VERVIAFKNAIGMEDADAAPVHIEVSHWCFVTRHSILFVMFSVRFKMSVGSGLIRNSGTARCFQEHPQPHICSTLSNFTSVVLDCIVNLLMKTVGRESFELR
jgi:hypothetical protein